LRKLGLNEQHLDVHLVSKGSNIHAEDERQAMKAKRPNYIIVLDQGSRSGPPVIDDGNVKSLVVDHHLSDEFPLDATVSQGSVSDISWLIICSRSFQHATVLRLQLPHCLATRSAKIWMKT
jgi:hypothetical protein